MPKITIDLTQDEYERIPGKKQPWLTRIAREALANTASELQQEVRAREIDAQPFVFKTIDGKILTARGDSPVQAAASLGLEYLDVTWAREGARKLGWLVEKETNPMDI